MKKHLIEFTEDPFCRIGAEVVSKGERRMVSDDERQLYVVQLGWAKCVETGEQGERKPGAQSLEIKNVHQKTT